MTRAGGGDNPRRPMSESETAPTPGPERIRRAEVVLPTTAFDADLTFFTRELAFRLDRIWPADRPSHAAISGYGTQVLLERSPALAPGKLRLEVEDAEAFAGGQLELRTPGGHHIALAPADPPLHVPETHHRFGVQRHREGESWGVGRAGMLYRDLLPDRLGGAMIASHIRIEEAGPVPDEVHFHAVAFQLIFCHRGWVRLVYEDQGPPFALGAGDCLIQPPEIRHRVLEASGGVEVIEIGVPAEHLTTLDHDLALPTPHHRPDRDFAGTRFVLHREAGARWEPWRLPGFEARETGIEAATRGLAGVRIARRIGGSPRSPAARHDGDILFGFVRSGSMMLRPAGGPEESVSAGDAFVVPPGLLVRFRHPSDDLEILEVALPGRFRTEFGPIPSNS